MSLFTSQIYDFIQSSKFLMKKLKFSAQLNIYVSDIWLYNAILWKVLNLQEVKKEKHNKIIFFLHFSQFLKHISSSWKIFFRLEERTVERFEFEESFVWKLFDGKLFLEFMQVSHLKSFWVFEVFCFVNRGFERWWWVF